ncbi:MAG: thioredoxin [Gemmatimonadota bacterium]|nr:thioredoxin [Gemmatimonadota bacterium]
MFFRKKKSHPSLVVHMGDEDFESEIAATAGVTVVDFWAPWCGPCRMMGPILEDVATDYADRGVTVVKVNTDEAPITAERFGIRSIPTLVFFRSGEPLFEMVGLVPQPVLQREIDSLLGTTGQTPDTTKEEE